MYHDVQSDISYNHDLTMDVYNYDMRHYSEFQDYSMNHESPVVLIIPDGYIIPGKPLNSSDFCNDFIPNVEYYDKSYFIEELNSGYRYNIHEV